LSPIAILKVTISLAPKMCSHADPDVPEITVSPDIVAEEIHLRRKNLQGTDEF